MKILVFAELYYPDLLGGGEFSTKQMAEGLASKGHEVRVLCLGRENREERLNGVYIKRKHIRGLSEHFLSLAKNSSPGDTFSHFEKMGRKWGDLFESRRWYEIYRSVIQNEAPDAVHTAAPMSYLGRFNLWKAAYDLNIPVSHVCRGPNLLKLDFLGGGLDKFNRRRNAKASSFLTALAAPSRFMLEAHMRAGIRGQAFNEVIYNAVDFEPAAPSEDLIKAKENLILYAGELSEKKGISTLIRAMEGLEGVRLMLIGEGDLKAALRTGGRTEVLDWMDRDELYTYMQKAKAVVLPSKWDEPFGRILIEAICNGTVAIGSDRGGIPEVLDHNEDHIFRNGDTEGLRSRIQRVLDLSPVEYMDEIQGQQRILSRFSDDKYTDNWERFFLRQLN